TEQVGPGEQVPVPRRLQSGRQPLGQIRVVDRLELLAGAHLDRLGACWPDLVDEAQRLGEPFGAVGDGPLGQRLPTDPDVPLEEAFVVAHQSQPSKLKSLSWCCHSILAKSSGLSFCLAYALSLSSVSCS